MKLYTFQKEMEHRRAQQAESSCCGGECSSETGAAGDKMASQELLDHG